MQVSIIARQTLLIVKRFERQPAKFKTPSLGIQLSKKMYLDEIVIYGIFVIWRTSHPIRPGFPTVRRVPLFDVVPDRVPAVIVRWNLALESA